jgi:hypothetical protein
MSRLGLILSTGVCAIALSGCIPAAAGLALTAANLVTGGGANNANGFRNPIDKQSTGQAVKQALSQLNDRVDPACQAMLDEHQKGKGGAAETGTPASGSESAEASDAAAPKEQPRNLLSKLPQPPADVARSAETAPAAEAEGEAKPVKAALVPAAGVVPPEDRRAPTRASASTAAPGQCEHRLVCLPGTPKPTLMLMCPGKDGVGKDGKTTTVAGPAADQPKGDAPAVAAGEAADTSGKPQETAAAEAAAVPAGVPEPARAEAPASPAVPTMPERGVADWNWAYDPAKQL